MVRYIAMFIDLFYRNATKEIFSASKKSDFLGTTSLRVVFLFVIAEYLTGLKLNGRKKKYNATSCYARGWHDIASQMEDYVVSHRNDNGLRVMQDHVMSSP